MCNKKERKRDRRWYLFPVSTLGAVYFAVHGGTGRFCFFFEAGRGDCFFFPRRDGAFFFFFSEAGRGGCFFFPRRDGVAFFFFSTGRDGAVFFFFSRAGTGRLFLAVAIFLAGRGKIVTPSRQRRLNRPASRPCKALIFFLPQPVTGRQLIKHSN